MATILSSLGINKIWQDQRGQDLTEFALLGGLVAAIIIAISPELVSLSQNLVALVAKVTQTALSAAGLE